MQGEQANVRIAFVLRASHAATSRSCDMKYPKSNTTLSNPYNDHNSHPPRTKAAANAGCIGTPVATAAFDVLGEYVVVEAAVAQLCEEDKLSTALDMLLTIASSGLMAHGFPLSPTMN